jgi:hypothetical protein
MFLKLSMYDDALVLLFAEIGSTKLNLTLTLSFNLLSKRFGIFFNQEGDSLTVLGY